MRVVVFVLCVFLLSCGRHEQQTFPSPDGQWEALVLSDPEGHSPMTTTRVAVRRRGSSDYREVRLPPPDERFSTLIDGWESPGVLRIHATTLEGEVSARYFCATGRVEVIR